MSNLRSDWKELNTKEKINLCIKLIEKHKLTAYEIAKKIDISAQTVTNIIKDQVKNPRDRILNKILNYIEVVENGTTYDCSTTESLGLEILNKIDNFQNSLNEFDFKLNEMQQNLLKENFSLFEKVLENKGKLRELKLSIKNLKSAKSG